MIIPKQFLQYLFLFAYLSLCTLFLNVFLFSLGIIGYFIMSAKQLSYNLNSAPTKKSYNLQGS